jgi:hypothetical protein
VVVRGARFAGLYGNGYVQLRHLVDESRSQKLRTASRQIAFFSTNPTGILVAAADAGGTMVRFSARQFGARPHTPRTRQSRGGGTCLWAVCGTRILVMAPRCRGNDVLDARGLAWASDGRGVAMENAVMMFGALTLAAAVSRAARLARTPSGPPVSKPRRLAPSVHRLRAAEAPRHRDAHGARRPADPLEPEHEPTSEKPEG